MLHTIRTYIEKHRLLRDDGSPILVGLSGGADSVALLSVLVRLGYPCIAAHCNFHLRGEESMRDEAFARQFAEKLSIPFLKIDFDTRKYASEHHVSIEMAARDLRYAWFEEQRKREGAQAIAVAHHRDDSVETVVMNLVRGSGLRGLTGIHPKNGYVVRPLLCVSRKEIEAWLAKEGLAFVSDSTNFSTEYTRNFIRMRLLPAMEEINPAARQTIARTAEHLANAEAIYFYMVEEVRRQVWVGDRLNTQVLLSYPAPETLLYEMLRPYGFSRLVCADVFAALEKEPGRWFASEEWRIVTARGYLQLSSRQMGEGEKEEYQIDWTQPAKDLPISLSFTRIDDYDPKSFVFDKDRSIAYLDLGKLSGAFTLRRWEKGDWFVPFGMSGRKKLSDYFTDRKYNRVQKEEAWVLTCGDKIAWIVNERADNRFRVDSKTKSVLQIKFQGKR